MSLHDITPNVYAKIRAVYCHNPSPFYRPPIRNLLFNYKEYLFSLFYKYLYKINIHKNNYIVVQQQWLKTAFSRMFEINDEQIIVSKPIEQYNQSKISQHITTNNAIKTFLYPAFPRTFKNFEIICKACEILENKGIKNFMVTITLSGKENSYAKNIYSKYKHLNTVKFAGLISPQQMSEEYNKTDCLIFPSMLETWGLPISEFSVYDKPMIIADLPYAHETSEGSQKVAFFNPNNDKELADKINNVIDNNLQEFKNVPKKENDALTVTSWDQLFSIILKND